MIDTLYSHLESIRQREEHSRFGLTRKEYIVVEFHRNFNTDSAAALSRLLSVVQALANRSAASDFATPRVVWPVHPRVMASVKRLSLEAQFAAATARGVRVLDPMDYFSFVGLVDASLAVVTDSGGVLEEASVLGVPCVTLRPSIERPVTVTHGTNVVAPEVSPPAVIEALNLATHKAADPTRTPIYLWDGQAADRFAKIAIDLLNAGEPCRAQSEQLAWLQKQGPTSAKVVLVVSLDMTGNPDLGVAGGSIYVNNILRLMAAVPHSRVIYTARRCDVDRLASSERSPGILDFPKHLVTVLSPPMLCRHLGITGMCCDACSHARNATISRDVFLRSLAHLALALRAQLVFLRE